MRNRKSSHPCRNDEKSIGRTAERAVEFETIIILIILSASEKMKKSYFLVINFNNNSNGKIVENPENGKIHKLRRIITIIT